MTLTLLCRRQITLQRATVVAGTDGSQIRTWQNVMVGMPASILKIRMMRRAEHFRQSASVDTVVMTPVNTGAQLDDRIFDGLWYYRVRWVMNLGDRDQAWAIYTQWLDPQDDI